MNLQPSEIFKEYENGVQHKSSMGKNGLFEQNKINERFFIGDQWYGANCGNDRPLVRYNVIKRIGDYKMSQILNDPINVEFSVEGISKPNEIKLSAKTFNGAIGDNEANSVAYAFGKYFDVTSERLDFKNILF